MTERKELIERLRELAEDKVLSVNYCVAVSHAADMLEADAQQSDQITGLQVAIRNLTEQPAAPQEPYELDQCDVERAKRCLEALRVVLGIDSPETRGWAPIVQQEARRAIDRALAALVEQTAQIQRLKSSVPQEPVRNDMSIQLLERLIKTLTNLGYATPEGGIEAFNADLPTQLYHLCFGVDRVLSALKTVVPQGPVAWQPIETAPKDGSRVLLWWDGAVREGWCAGAGKSRDGGDWWRSYSLTVCAGRPTQWMSLPPAPEGSPQKSPVLTDAEIIQAIEQRFAPAVSAVPVAYLAWRDGKPCWDGDDCVCEDAVYPVDHDDDRTSMPVYLAPQPQRPRLTDAEIHELLVSEIYPNFAAMVRAVEKKVRGEA